MVTERSLTVSDKIVLAAFVLETEGHTPFTAEDLVVAAWRSFPGTFGLAGYTDATGYSMYPDSNRVFAEIMGAKPIRKRGFLVKVGEKMYELTETGRALARRLRISQESGSVARGGDAKLGLPRDMLAEVKRLLGSRALQKVRGNQSSALTFYDACVFWGITPQSSAIDLHGRLANISGTIAAARQLMQGESSRLQHGGDLISVDMVDLLERTNSELLERFQTELKMIKKRTDQRRI